MIKNLNMTAVTGSYSSAHINTFYASVPSTDISLNRSALKFEYSGLAINPFHNFYEIHYPSDMLAMNNQITFFSRIVDFTQATELAEYNIRGFSGNIYGFDVTDMTHPKLLTNIANTGGFYVFRRNEDSTAAAIKKYFISASVSTPSIENISFLNLRNINDSKYSNVDMIVVSADEFIESANNFAEYRAKQSGLKISVVPLSKIYAEFSYSRLDLAAIRNYIQYAYEN
jgi:hypothetical protein